jgi:hypothetical protein
MRVNDCATSVAAADVRPRVYCGEGDEPVLLVDPSGPIAVVLMAEPLRFADTFSTAVTNHVFDKLVDPAQQLAVVGLPPEIVIPGAVP